MYGAPVPPVTCMSAANGSFNCQADQQMQPMQAAGNQPMHAQMQSCMWSATGGFACQGAQVQQQQQPASGMAIGMGMEPFYGGMPGPVGSKMTTGIARVAKPAPK
jgi:hypothetical protein